MRKLLVALMIMAFAVTAFADVKIAGSYNVEGNYKNNVNSFDDGTTEDENMYWEHEFKLKVNASTDKDTYFKSKLEIADNTWTTDPKSDYMGETTHFQVERAYMGHNFGAVKLDAGLMNGGAWSYDFGNNVEGFYRIKATIPAGPGNVIAIVEKNSESNEDAADKDEEKDDTDSYILAYSGKVGGLKIAPLFKYVTKGSTQDDADMDDKIVVLDLGIGGNFGAVGFEAELAYKSTDKESGDDPSVYGIYANVFTKVSGATVGFLTAYSSYDKDTNTAYDMGDDFDDSIGFMIGDEGLVGSQDLSGSYSGLGAVWANALYASYGVNDKLTVDGAFVYAMSTIDNSASAFEDATAYEIDLGADYAITGALTYYVDFGYASVDLDGGDLDPAYKVQHGLSLSF